MSVPSSYFAGNIQDYDYCTMRYIYILKLPYIIPMNLVHHSCKKNPVFQSANFEVVFAELLGFNLQMKSWQKKVNNKFYSQMTRVNIFTFA